MTDAFVIFVHVFLMTAVVGFAALTTLLVVSVFRIITDRID